MTFDFELWWQMIQNDAIVALVSLPFLAVLFAVLYLIERRRS
jgi:hypothetical protein